MGVKSRFRSLADVAVIGVSNPKQSATWRKGRLDNMVESTRIVSAKLEGEYGLVVTFSDGTDDVYTVEELLELRPRRDLVREPPELVN